MPKNVQLYSAIEEQALMADLWSEDIRNSPLNYVRYAFPWGQKDTPLEHRTGPRKWQMEVLMELEAHLRENRQRQSARQLPEMFREVIASGRGIGKSALFSWLTMWLLSTRLGSTVIVTANTEGQLTSKTWAEMRKWHTMAINTHWFDAAAMSLKPAEWFEKVLKADLKIDTGYYYAQAQLWSEEKPDAFAGAHNPLGMMVLYDEASGIPQCIWTVTEGFFTEPEPDRYWLAFSNPRNNTGAFFECFHRFRDFWRRRSIDARTVEGTDPKVYEKIIAQHGPDSDEARVEVLGQFPNAGARQFIPMDFVQGAREREAPRDANAPLVIGVDVARYGEDSSVIAFRAGRDARSIPWQKYRGIDTMALSDRVADAIGKYNPEAVFVDANGVGGAVVDRLRQLGYRVIEVHSQGSSGEKERYLNKRSEIWDRMKDWLKAGAIPLDTELADDLKGPEYEWNRGNGSLQLESKEVTKRRGLASPDMADALALTFAATVARKDLASSRHGRRQATARDVDYAMFGSNG